MNRRAPTERVELTSHLWVLWGAAALVALSATGADPDLWGHLRFGLDWWKTFSLPSVDPYSFTQGRAWVNHEWLSEATMAGGYRAGGIPGLIVVKVVTIGAALGILRWRLRRATAVVTIGALSFAVAGVLPISLTVRPQLWSVLALASLAALLGSLEEDDKDPDAKALLACAAIFAVWANFHGGWITGAGMLGVFAGVRTWLRPRSAPRWIAFAAAGISATLINPYGVGLWRFLASTVRASRPDISEWEPMGLDSPVILWVPIAGLLSMALLLSRRTETRPSPATWASLLVLVVAALRVHRVSPLISVAGVILLAPQIAKAWGHLFRITVPNREAAFVMWIPAVVAVVATAAPATKALRCISINADWRPDLTLAPALRGTTGKLWVTFDWGEYALWHFGPDLKVSVDGRRVTVYSDALLRLHRDFERGDAAAQAEFLKLAPDYVWLPATRTAARDWLAANGYWIDLSSPSSFIAARIDRPPLSAPSLAAGNCFP